MLRNWSLNPLAKVAIGILRKYGADAHIYLPGVGTVNGITAGNYLDSAGTTAASVDNPVGLSLDALQAMTLGSELISAQDLTTWTPNSGSVVINNATTATYSADAQITKTVATVAGKTYWLTISGSKTGGSVIGYSNSDQNSTGVIFNGNFGTYAFVAQATGYISIRSTTAQVLTIASVSVREIPGIHATQATTANKPLLKQSGAKYYWQHDSTDLLTATYPAGYESATIIDAVTSGVVTNQGVNVVGSYSIGPSVNTAGRILLRTAPTAPELAVLQAYARSLI